MVPVANQTFERCNTVMKDACLGLSNSIPVPTCLFSSKKWLRVIVVVQIRYHHTLAMVL